MLLANLLAQLGLLATEWLAWANGVITQLAGMLPNTVLHVLLAAGTPTTRATPAADATAGYSDNLGRCLGRSRTRDAPAGRGSQGAVSHRQRRRIARHGQQRHHRAVGSDQWLAIEPARPAHLPRRDQVVGAKPKCSRVTGYAIAGKGP